MRIGSIDRRGAVDEKYSEVTPMKKIALSVLLSGLAIFGYSESGYAQGVTIPEVTTFGVANIDLLQIFASLPTTDAVGASGNDLAMPSNSPLGPLNIQTAPSEPRPLRSRTSKVPPTPEDHLTGYSE